MKIVNHEQGTPAWLEWREQGVGASESAALFNESPYFTARELWLTKKKRIPSWFMDQGSDYIFDKGHEFEEKMRGEYFAMTGEEFRPLCIEHDDYPFIIASLDGAIMRGPLDIYKIFEAKLVSAEVKKEIAKSGRPPEHHWIQIQQQLLISDADCCVYFAHDLTGEAVVVEVYPDHAFIAVLKQALIDFDQSLINNQEPPMAKDDFHFSDRDEDFKELALLHSRKERLKKMFESLEEKYKNKMADIMKTEGHPNVASITHAVKIKKMCKSYINYENIPEVQKLSKDYIESFKTQSAPYLQAWFPKQKAKS